MITLSDGFHLICKEDCATCRLLLPVMAQLAQSQLSLKIYTQDDLAFPPKLNPVDDTSLERSYHLNIETVPTLIQVRDGQEIARLAGWTQGERETYAELAARLASLGDDSVELDPAELAALHAELHALGCEPLLFGPLGRCAGRLLDSGEAGDFRRSMAGD